MNKLLAMLLFMSLIGCKSAKDSKQTDTSNGVEKAEVFTGEGRWVWVASSFQTRGMKAPQEKTPESLGYSIVIVFDDDYILIEKDGQPLNKVPFKLTTNADNIVVLEVETLQNDDLFFVASGPVYLKGDELLISGGYNDAGEDQTYRRE